MKDQPSERRRRVATRVRCLECGNLYAKPTGGGTVAQNPGCPRCGYIGWIPAALEVIPSAEPIHSAADRQPHRGGRQH